MVYNKEYAKEWYIKNRARIRARENKRYEENKDKLSKQRKDRYQKLKKEFLLTYKIGKSCDLCGSKKHPEILQFHHKDRKGKSFTIGNIKITERYSPKKLKLIQEEIKKCILLCPNCHAVLHLKERRPNV